LGLVMAMQFLPILLFGVWGGVVADGFDKRRVLYATQFLSGLLALVLGLLVVSGLVQLWMLYVLAACLGLINVVDNPTRQSFVVEMVGKGSLQNAVALNSSLTNTARVIGPGIAGVLIATVGIGACFIINAVSYVAALISLWLMREDQLHRAAISARGSGQIRAGLKYVWDIPTLRATLIMMFIMSTFAYEFPVVLPLFATITLHGDAGAYSAMMSATGFGAVLGGLYTAGRPVARETQIVAVAIVLGLFILLAAVMPTLLLMLIVLVIVGVLSVMFIAYGNTTLQLTSEPVMRGRVMALWSIAFLGTMPIGGPIIGFISDYAGPRVGLGVGGLAAIVAGVAGLYILRAGGSSLELGSSR
jgi:MFS family permease